MLDSINEFILYYFDYYLKRLEIKIPKDTIFIGNRKREYICIGKFMFLFGRWVYL